MLRTMFLTTLTAFLATTGCSSCAPDCDRLANFACATQGQGSDNCIEVRKRARQARDEDQRYCREALAIVSEESGSSKPE